MFKSKCAINEKFTNRMIVVKNTIYFVFAIRITNESTLYPNAGLIHHGKSIIPLINVMNSGDRPYTSFWYMKVANPERLCSP